MTKSSLITNQLLIKMAGLIIDYLLSPDIRATSGEKAKQNGARNNAKCSQCFQFLCNNSDLCF